MSTDGNGCCVPQRGDHNWALADYFALANDGQRALKKIVGRVSFPAIVPNTPGDTEVRKTCLKGIATQADQQHPLMTI
jgi:hypothetical protein